MAEVMQVGVRERKRQRESRARIVVLATTGLVRGRRRQGVQRIPACDYQKSSEASRRSIYASLRLVRRCVKGSGSVSALASASSESIMPFANSHEPATAYRSSVALPDDPRLMRASRLPTVVL
jgi:hypothetical protein